MTEENKTEGKPKNPEIDFNAVVGFLTSIDASLKCPVCNHEAWLITAALKHDESQSFYQGMAVCDESGGLMLGGSASQRFVSVTCQKCGNTRLHDIKYIFSWAEKNLWNKSDEPKQ